MPLKKAGAESNKGGLVGESESTRLVDRSSNLNRFALAVRVRMNAVFSAVDLAEFLGVLFVDWLPIYLSRENLCHLGVFNFLRLFIGRCPGISSQWEILVTGALQCLPELRTEVGFGCSDFGTVPTRKPLCRRRRRETRSVGNVVSRKRLKLVYNTGETMEDSGVAVSRVEWAQSA
ncbi:hypothetical protein KQX54_006065 [Cotesia glomerata]|uniref:Uncharacterized protein n=1 Tax=Cotesia glomerata TaxID=32391 RepID=A0AAV7I407_COTGL|nr:hypothetical protein KQX54_006065 [Cotesia glomerata]